MFHLWNQTDLASALSLLRQKIPVSACKATGVSEVSEEMKSCNTTYSSWGEVPSQGNNAVSRSPVLSSSSKNKSSTKNKIQTLVLHTYMKIRVVNVSLCNSPGFASTWKMWIRFKNPHPFKEQLLGFNLPNTRNNKDFAAFKEKA